MDHQDSEKVGSKDQFSRTERLKVDDDQETNGSRLPRGGNVMDWANQAKNKSKYTKPKTEVR